MGKVETCRAGNVVLLAAITGVGCLCATSAYAASITWNGSTSFNFETATNWVGGVAPANDTTTDSVLYSGTVTANQPTLTTSRSLFGVQFGSGGWTLGSNSSSNTLTLGTNGIFGSNTTGTNTVSANLTLPVNIASLINVNFGSGSSTVGSSRLDLTGSFSVGSAAQPSTYALVFGSSTRRDTVSLRPSAGQSVAFYTNGGSGQASLNTGLGGTVELGGAAGNINILSNTVSAGIKYTSGSTLQVTSGTWLTNDIGSNNSGQSNGIAEISGGTLATAGGRYIVQAGGLMVVDGGTLLVTGSGNTVSNSGYLKLGSSASGAAAVLNVTSGTVDVAKSTGGTSQIGDVASGLMNQNGGSVKFGATTSYNVFTNVTNTNTTSDLLIGSSGITSAGSGNTLQFTTISNAPSAYTLAGGTLTVVGKISATAQGTASTNGSQAPTNPNGVVQPGTNLKNFNFVGGTLAVGTFDATLLGSSPTATFTGAGLTASGSNQVLVSNNVGTLMNYGGTVAPGGAASSGRMSITGNYAGNGGASTLSFDLGGTSSATSFAAAATTYDNILASGNVALNDQLRVRLTNNYTPGATDNLTILQSAKAINSLSGSFTNTQIGKSGATRTVVDSTGLASMALTYFTGGDVTNGSVKLGSYSADNTYASPSGASWDAANAGSWSVFDPGSTSAPASIASGALAQFADGSGTGTGSNSVSLGSTRNIQGVRFASAIAGHNYAIGGTGSLVLDNTTNASTAKITDASIAGNLNTIDVPITLKSDLSATVTNASTRLTLSGPISGSGRKVSVSGAGTVVLSGANTYDGGTTLTGGTLRADNATASLGTGTTTVSGGVIAGTGATGGPVNLGSGGTITAGTGAGRRTNAGVGAGDVPGKLTSGGQSWAGGATSVFKITSATGTAGTSAGYDQLVMPTLSLSLNAAGAYTLILTNAANTTLSNLDGGTQLTLIRTTGGISLAGTNVANNANLTSLFVLDTSDIGIPSDAFTIVASGTAGSAQDLLLSYNGTQAAPEPGSMLLAGLASSPFLLRRRSLHRRSS